MRNSRPPLDFIDFFQKRSTAFPEKIIELYKKGCTQHEISKELAVSKHSVGKVIKKQRSSSSSKNEFSIKWWKQRIKKTKVNPYFGYYVFQGELVKDPKEYPIIQLIVSLSKQGKRLCDIKRELENRNIKPRKSKVWDRNMIKKIIARESGRESDFNIIQFKGKKGG